MGIQYCVISHTHWDREWYLSFEEFRMRLVDLVDNLLRLLEEDEQFRFHLDAQTIVLEDYLEIRPYQREKLKEYISQGRILVGPWYVQNDFFLTSGESTIRNLLIGSRIAEEFGECSKVGYVPDQFGITSQVPQIFNGFGIDTCLFARGYQFDRNVKAEFYWKSENDSKLLAIYMPYWYNNAQRFPADINKSIKMLGDIKEKLDSTSSTTYYLLMNGVDHLEAQENLSYILERMNNVLEDGQKIRQCTMEEYMNEIKQAGCNLPEYTGEMRNGREDHVLTGTLSSRVYLKQWNVRCQCLIEKRIEPIYSMIELMGGKEYPSDYIYYLWKLLIQNHPHDSICGCSIDKVHQHMEDRFKKFEEAGKELLKRGLDFIGTYISRSGLSDEQYLITVFNTNNTQCGCVVEATLDFPEEENVSCFRIVDNDDEEIPYVVLDKKRKAKGVLSPINLPGVLGITQYKIKLWLDSVKGSGYRALIVTPNKRPLYQIEEKRTIDKTMENEYLKVCINDNGTINIHDKSTNIMYNNLLAIEDREDIGNAYVYKNNPDCVSTFSRGCNAAVSAIERNELSTTILIEYQMHLPSEYDFANTIRSKELIMTPVRIFLTLDKGNPRLDVKVEIDNKVKDHRMRVLIPTGIPTNISQAGSPFDVIKRDKMSIKRGFQVEKHHPNTDYINVDGNGYGISVFNKGLYEYENMMDDRNTIALTLFRGNSYICKDENGLPIEEKWVVPENQCMGNLTFELSIYPHKGNFIDAEVAHRVQDFINPPFTHFQPVNSRKFSGGRPFVQDSEIAELFYRDKKYHDISMPLEFQLIDKSDSRVILSCIKKKEKGEGLIIRLYNVSGDEFQFDLRVFKKLKDAYLTSLLEKRICKLTVEENTIKKIKALPKQIVTIEIT